MHYPKYLALLAVLMIPLAYSQAQIGVSIGVPRRGRWFSRGRRPSLMLMKRQLIPEIVMKTRLEHLSFVLLMLVLAVGSAEAQTRPYPYNPPEIGRAHV